MLIALLLLGLGLLTVESTVLSVQDRPTVARLRANLAVSIAGQSCLVAAIVMGLRQASGSG